VGGWHRSRVERIRGKAVGRQQPARHTVPERTLDVVGEGRRVVSASSPAKQAPRIRNVSMISAVHQPVARSGRRRRGAAFESQPRSPRSTTEIGVAFEGEPAGASASVAPPAGVSFASHDHLPSCTAWSSHQAGTRGAVAPGARAPRHRRHLEALELLDDCRQAALATELRAGATCCQRSRKAHEVFVGLRSAPGRGAAVADDRVHPGPEGDAQPIRS